MVGQERELFDVGIVGAGPAGSTCAYYLAQQGRRVLLLDKAKFPRDKLCGDAICTRAQNHLRRMGVLQEIEAERQGHWAKVGGIVSPSGIRGIGDSAPFTGGPMVIAIKRKVMDAKIARAAANAGAELVENYKVVGADFDTTEGYWTIHGHRRSSYRVRMLVSCDGASSSLARHLGYVKTPPDAVCSRAYIKADSTNFDADGVLFYPREVVPGYAAIFREAQGELNLAVYLIPGGNYKSSDLHRIFKNLTENNEDIRDALGPNVEMERMRGGGLRLGGIRKSYGDHLLIVGDAAGHIDPLTGEGIHYAMDAAQFAAETIGEAIEANNFSAAFLKRYHERWQASFGWDFYWSKKIAQFTAKVPIFLDACAEVTRRKGPRFLAEWAEVMTGNRPKSAFFQPNLFLPILFEAGRQWFRQNLRKPTGNGLAPVS